MPATFREVAAIATQELCMHFFRIPIHKSKTSEPKPIKRTPRTLIFGTSVWCCRYSQVAGHCQRWLSNRASSGLQTTPSGGKLVGAPGSPVGHGNFFCPGGNFWKQQFFGEDEHRHCENEPSEAHFQFMAVDPF